MSAAEHAAGDGTVRSAMPAPHDETHVFDAVPNQLPKADPDLG